MSRKEAPHMLSPSPHIEKPDHARTWSDCSVQSSTSGTSETSRSSLGSTDSNSTPTQEISRRSTLPMLLDIQDVTPSSAETPFKGKGSGKTHRRSTFCFVG
mmetsp:Transcript_1120/g.1718  ORF Transcript_1120/g.1718 Transcript_1120/m.1718 type:complete len:101 (-) Transcript_1120:258-560(-)